MFKNYLKSSWRNLSKSRTYSIINILGLAAGLAGFIIILLYLNFELSYDKWNPELKKSIRFLCVQKRIFYREPRLPWRLF